MQITYLGHSCFRLRGKKATVVTDPFPKSVGWMMPKTKTDLVTLSHTQHDDHNALDRVEGTKEKSEPYVIEAPGEYEVSGVGVFGWGSYHDDKQGKERGKNTIYNIHVDNVRVAHLGDLGHALADDLIENIGAVDVLMVPVGGVYTINADKAVEVVAKLQPSLVIPMHYRTSKHNTSVFGSLDEVDVFVKEMGAHGLEEVDKISVSQNDLPDETTLVLLKI